MSDWSTIASLSTAAGTLVLAVATFSSVRSANRSARVAERSLLTGILPLLVPSRREGPPQKVGFSDAHWVQVPGGGAVAEVTDGVIYLAIALRNVGNGIAVLDRWEITPERLADVPHGDTTGYRRLTRDLYISPSDNGFWQGALRDPSDPLFASVRDVIEARRPFTIDVMCGDYEGGQHLVTRFGMSPVAEDRWVAAVSRHWNLDRPAPR